MDHHVRVSQQGFTLIELVAVLVLLATLAGTLYTRSLSDAPRAGAEAAQLARALRHAQALALGQGRSLTLDIQSASAYVISDGVSAIRDPQGETQAFALDTGIALAGNDIQFDGLGRPVSGGNLIAAAQSWILSGSGTSFTVSVQPLTGSVAVTP
jgi:prepilin-type N-terminal cleavage/methylation domain-containing protein